MKPFLYQVASLFYAQYGAEVSRLAFVFPNRRAGLFFQKYLAEVSPKPLFSPAILTISDLFLQLSGKQLADRMQMLFTLYRIYIRKSAQEESFDEFLYWGEMLLNDFDDVDKYMVNARMLFSNVTDLRAIESDFNFLNEKQIAAIRAFWSAFFPKGDSPNQRNFLAVWQILYDLYTELREILAAEGKGYEGMIAREVVERIQDDEGAEFPYKQIVFVGLNALSVVEEKLLLRLKERGIADFYWDYASAKVTDKDNKASRFVERNKSLFPSRLDFPREEALPPATIEVIGIPSGIGQAKQVHNLLNEIVKATGGMTEEESLRTAVILPDEHLLIPVLNSIPESIRRINVTMGYPLAGAPIASLVEYILALHTNLRYTDGRPTFYFRDVLPVLNHRYIVAGAPELIPDLIKDIRQNNRINIEAAALQQTPFLRTLFTPIEQTAGISDYLISILSELNNIMDSGKREEENEATDYQSSITDIEQEFIFHFFTTVNRLKEVMRETGVEMKLDTYFRLLKRLTDLITIPFRGEPLSGLQLMGVLETRALDFDRLIILSMNEGIFPQKKASASFIPYNLRRGFDLPAYEHQDSVWAYHFYRLIHRAGHISLLYDSRNNGVQTGEMSRFIHQLHYHYELSLHKKLMVYNVSSSRMEPLRIKKTGAVMQRLAAYRKGGASAISASAINTWLDCPLKFYFSVVEGIQEEEEVSETIESNVFGSILHKVMEELYMPFRGKMLTADLLKAIRKDTDALSHTIAAAFAGIFFKTQTIRPLTGQNFLIGEMIRKYVEKILERDGRELTPFRYIESEKKMKDVFTLSDGSEIQLKGFIDRIDEVQGAIRIIDYKSGSGLSTFHTPESLFDISEKDRPKAIMQVFMYAWMFGRLPESSGKTLRPGIYYMRTLFSPDFDPGIYQRIERGKSVPVDNFAAYAPSFENSLRACLDEIFSADTPFVQTPTGKACAYCPFKDICG
ncbi:MAG: PD-(D/E)XK nuclease family protein [Tannerellaceae bacterium]|nr:PD-(D/E)XK nuclease family protein [Tannerellaceae bacterium]